MGRLYEYNGKYPAVAESALIYDTAEITGDDHRRRHCGSIRVRIIGNSHGPVRIGENVQILENSVLHLRQTMACH